MSSPSITDPPDAVGSPDPGGGSTGARETPSPTADALVDVALGLFAERGYDGTSVRAITEAAGANIAAVTYHFGSKQALFEAVLEAILVPVGREIREASQGPGAPLDRIRGVVAALLRHMGRNPAYPRLMLQQLSTQDVPHPVVQRTMRQGLGMLQGLVEEGQRDGTIRPGDSRLMAVSLMSQPVHMSIVARPLRIVAGLDEEPEALIDRMAEHAADFAVRAMEAGEEMDS